MMEDDDSICLDMPEDADDILESLKVNDVDEMVHYDYIVKETDLAILFSIDNIELWHPKKYISHLDHESKTFFLPLWLFQKKLCEYNENLKQRFIEDMLELLDNYNAVITNNIYHEDGDMVFMLNNSIMVKKEDFN